MSSRLVILRAALMYQEYSLIRNETIDSDELAVATLIVLSWFGPKEHGLTEARALKMIKNMMP